MDTSTPLDGATILLVDDNPANLGVLTQLLTAHGWRVLVAQQGEIGLQIAQRVQPDLILLDVLLPGMDGFETCQRLKAIARTAEIPVLFMTVRMEAEDKLKGFQAGAVDYITKPFQAEEVLARITTHLRLRQLTHSLQAQNAQLQQEIVERRQAEQALQRAHIALEQQVAERTAALLKTEALYYISHSLITIEQLPDLLQAVVDKIVEALPADRVMLTLVDFEKRLVSYYVKGGPGVEHLGDVSFEGLWAGLVGWAMRELTPALSPKGAPDPRESLPVQQRRAETDCGAIIVAPLRYRERTLGTITAINRPDQPDFTQADVDLMMAMASQAAMTIENTQLLLSLRKAHAELEQRVIERTAALIQANADLQAQIGERRRIEAELLTERNLLRTLIDNAPEQIYVKDTESRFVLANAATLKQLNINTFDQLVGKTDFDLFPAELAAQYLGDEQAVLQQGQPMINKEESGPHEHSNRPLWSLTTKVPVRDAHGQIIGLVGMSRDITEHKRAEELLHASEAQLRVYTQRLVAVQEAERARIARDLHDEIGQMLTGLKLVLAIGTPSMPALVLSRLAEAQALINDLTTRVREISLDLRPAMLDDLGLLPTLLWYVKRYTEQTHIQVIMKHTGLDQRVAPDVEIAVYRLVQEGLTNVARHADVPDVAIWLWRTADSIGVQIKDQGRGFIPKEVLAAHTSSGLAGMLERTRLLGGQLTIESAPGHGTRLTAELPLGTGLE